MLVLDAKSAERPTLECPHTFGGGARVAVSAWVPGHGRTAQSSRPVVDRWGLLPLRISCARRWYRSSCSKPPAPTVGNVTSVTDENIDTDDTDTTGAAFSGEIPGLEELQAQFEQMSPEEQEQIAEAQQAMEESRARLASVPAEVVVTNHVMGLYELAAIHLSSEEPDLAQAALAIDALACLVDGLGSRLGPEAPTMVDALQNIRLAFVQIKGQISGQAAPG